MRNVFRLFAVVTVFIFATACAQDLVLASNQQDALKACEEKAAQAPEGSRQKMLSSCQCMVANIDFAMASSLNKDGKANELQKLYDKATEACTE